MGKYEFIHEELINYLKQHETSKKILDVGCGVGIVLKGLQDAGFTNLHGCDGYSKPEIKNFKNFKLTDFEKKLPYKDNEFDIVVSSEVIEHLKYPNAFIDELHRILKKKGILLLSTVNIHTLIGKMLFLFTGNFVGFLKTDYFLPLEGYYGHITPFSLKHTLRIYTNKFRIKKTWYNSFMIPFTKISIPLRTQLFGNNVFVVLEKK